MQRNPSFTTKDAVTEVQNLLYKHAKPVAEGSDEAILQAAGINELDTAFVFTQSRLDAVDALVAAHVQPEEAFSIIDQLRGEFISAIPKNIELAAKSIYGLVSSIVIEQMVSPAQVKSDILDMLSAEGKSAYDLKQDYSNMLHRIKQLLETEIKGLNPIEFISAQFTQEFYQKIEIEAIVAKEITATDMVYNSINSHVKLPAEYMPGTIAAADVGKLYNIKMLRLSNDVFTPWLNNHTSYDFPKPICPPTAPLAAQTRNEGLVVGAMGISALWMASYLAKPVYQKLLVPVAKTTVKIWSDLGLMLFSSIEKSQYSQAKKQRQEQSSSVVRATHGLV
jgi:hypothetical protein